MQAFGDGFDLYATVPDTFAGYWDSGSNNANAALVAGRFSGSQCLQSIAGGAYSLVKSSGANDAVHHIVLAIRQTATITGSTLGVYIQFSDGATNQCCIVFRSDGAILLTSATPAGTVLDTYTGAVSAANTWYAFEIEVVINNTTGSWAVRKNGNTSNDHALGSLNTRPGTNNYANKITLQPSGSVSAQQIDDLLWRSDPTSVPWVGDIRCYTRMPASDVSTQFSRAATVSGSTANNGNTAAVTANRSQYNTGAPFTAAFDIAVSSATVTMTTGYTGNMKCALFAYSGGVVGAVLGSATAPLSNPVSGANTFTFSPAVAIAKGTQFVVGVISDTTSGTYTALSTTSAAISNTVTYAAFPTSTPTMSGSSNQIAVSYAGTANSNASLVSEPQQDGATSYVYDSNVGDADFYAIAALSGTPASTVAVTTRGFLEKSDAGSRAASVQLKSGGTTVASTSTFLSTSFGWLFRTDLVDPNTGSAWTATGVNNCAIGPIVTA